MHEMDQQPGKRVMMPQRPLCQAHCVAHHQTKQRCPVATQTSPGAPGARRRGQGCAGSEINHESNSLCSGILGSGSPSGTTLTAGMLSGLFTSLFGLGYFWNIHVPGYFVLVQVRAFLPSVPGLFSGRRIIEAVSPSAAPGHVQILTQASVTVWVPACSQVASPA